MFLYKVLISILLKNLCLGIWQRFSEINYKATLLQSFLTYINPQYLNWQATLQQTLQKLLFIQYDTAMATKFHLQNQCVENAESPF